jgi:tetratricopeptide (TPR) repeat protein
MEKGDYEKALGYNLQVYQAFEQMHSWNNMAALLGNIGIIYASLGDRVPPGPGQDSLYQKALASYSKALDMQRELGDPNATAVQLNNLGTLYTVLKQYGKARAFLEEGLELYTRIGSYDGVRDNEKSLSMLDSAQGDYKSALEHYKRYIAARDSISSEENIKKQTETELRYEFSQKEAQGKAEQDKKDTVTRIVLYSTAGGFVLVLLLAVFIFRSYRQKRRANVIITRQKEEVEQQKLLVEEQQKRVLDSIHYAKRIQRSLLPTEKYIERSLHNLK